MIVINVYRLFKISNDKRISKLSTQQWDLLGTQDRESENVRDNMIKDLTNEINNIQSTFHQVTLLIDTNESFNSKEQGISSLVEYTDMSDHIANEYGHNNEPNTYKRESQRIDYILCTSGPTTLI